MTHEDLLGLIPGESRSGSCTRPRTTAANREGDRLPGRQAGGEGAECSASRDHSHVTGAPRKKTLVRGVCHPVRCCLPYCSPGLASPRPSYCVTSVPPEGGHHVDSRLSWYKRLQAGRACPHITGAGRGEALSGRWLRGSVCLQR